MRSVAGRDGSTSAGRPTPTASLMRSSVVRLGFAAPCSTATSIRRSAGGEGAPAGDGDAFTVTDGPWTETKEALGGFYVFEAPDLDAALEIAKDVPAPFGGVELRPVMTFE